MRINILLTLITLLINTQVYAFDFKNFDWFDTSVGFALNPRTNIRTNDILVNNANLFYTNSDPIYEPIPILFFRFANIFINKDGGGIAFAHFPHFKLRALITVDGEGFKAPGMEERKNSWFAGGLLQYYLIQIKYLRDINSVSNGQNFRIDLFREKHFGKLQFEPHIGIQVWDRKYTNYYYGVKASEATSKRPQYHTKETLNYTFELRYIYTDGPRKYILIPMYKKYSREVNSSLFVVRDEEFRLTFGIVWKLF